MRAFIAELLGTFWLVLGGCGSAILWVTAGPEGIGVLGIALAFGLTVLTMAFALGPVSGCHLNPAVSIGLCVGGRFPASRLVPYIVAQVIGAALAAAALRAITDGVPNHAIAIAANGFGAHSPGHYTVWAALTTEFVMSMFFLLVILGVTERATSATSAPVAIGLALTLIHLISIPVTNTSVNPARSTGIALFAEAHWPMEQLWLFWVAPIAGAVVGALLYRTLSTRLPATA